MHGRKRAWLLALALGVVAPAALPISSPRVAWAAPAGRYRVGMKVRAKRACTVQGYQVKKGVVLSVVGVRSDDKGRVAGVDLAISGMTISDVPANVMDSLFAPA